MKPHTYSFRLPEACVYGLNGAIVIDYLRNRLTDHSLQDNDLLEASGRTWWRASIGKWALHLPFFTEYQLRTILNRLINQNAISCRNLNTDKFNKTLAYTSNPEAIHEYLSYNNGEDHAD